MSSSLLFAILAVVFVFGVIEVIWSLFRSSRKAPYERGKPLLTAAERTFFDVLERSIPTGVHIAPKVRIADILKVSGASGKAYGAAFGRIVFWEIIVFLTTLGVAYVYAWRKGVFQWR